jgi:hypothetical protein
VRPEIAACPGSRLSFIVAINALVLKRLGRPGPPETGPVAARSDPYAKVDRVELQLAPLEAPQRRRRSKEVMTDIRVGPLGPFPWIDLVLIGWFTLTALSVAYVAWDAWRNNPELTVMKWGWVLVTLYLGPIGLTLYVLSCKEPAPGTHERFIQPLWKQGLGSTIHCVAGDATGIIAAAVITGLLGLPMGVDLVIEYAAGFGFGLLIFQSLFMKDMMGGSYLAAVRHSLLPEWLSMNFMMTGMFPVMVILMMGRDMRAMEPTQLVFWGTMSAAVGVGLAVAYPVNVWMVDKGLKHGMGTQRALGKGGHSMQAEQQRWQAAEEPATEAA